MREILFRGKRTDCGEWVEGYLNQHRGRVIFDCCCNAINANDYYINDWVAKLDTDLYGCVYKVIPETVGQFTGLTDKNGVKIFEGDIVTGWFNHEKIVGYIFYGGNAQFFIQRDGIYGIALDNSDCWLEVIGNIHDNSELLKGGEGE